MEAYVQKSLKWRTSKKYIDLTTLPRWRVILLDQNVSCSPINVKLGGGKRTKQVILKILMF